LLDFFGGLARKLLIIQEIDEEFANGANGSKFRIPWEPDKLDEYATTMARELYAAPGLEHIYRPVKFRLRNSSDESVIIICSPDPLCALSHFFHSLLENYDPKEEIELLTGSCRLDAATSLFQHLHAYAFIGFGNTHWNAAWADLAARWQIMALAKHYKQLMQETVLAHLNQVRGARLCIGELDCGHQDTTRAVIDRQGKRSNAYVVSVASKDFVRNHLEETADWGSTQSTFTLVEMIGFMSPYSSYPLYRIDMKELCDPADQPST